jgi:PAS domain S-box-containing protein
MTPDPSAPTAGRSALVVQSDPGVRARICNVLRRHGFVVDSCSSPAEGAAAYRHQALVVTGAGPDSLLPAGLIAWLRGQPVSGEDRPYILATGPDDAAPGSAAREWDGVLPLPLDPAELSGRLPLIEQWIANRRRTKAGPAAPGYAVPLVQLAAGLAPVIPLVPSSGPGRSPMPSASPAPLPPGRRDSAAAPELSAADQLRMLIDHSPLAMALCDREMRYLLVNERWKRDFRLNGSEPRGRMHRDFFTDLGTVWPVSVERALEGTPQRRADDQWIGGDGTVHRVSWDLQPWVLAGGEVGGVTMTCEVLAPQRSAAPVNPDWEQAGRVLLEGSFAPVVTLDLRGQILAVNGAAANLTSDRTGRNPAGFCFWEVFVEENRRETVKIEFLAASQESREQSRFAFPPSFVERLQMGQRIRKVAWANTPRYDAEGRLAGVFCFGVVLPDSTGDLAESAAGAVTAAQVSPKLLDHVPFGLILLDAHRETVFANREHRALLGIDVEDFADIEHWVAAAAPRPELGMETARDWRESVWRRQATQTFTLRASDQSLREIEFRPRPSVDGGMILTLFDVTDRRREEEARRLSEVKFRALFRGVGVAIALEDPSGLLLDVNPVFESITGASRQEVRRTGMRDWVHPEDWAEVEKELRLGEQRVGVPVNAVRGLEIRIRSREGGATRARLSVSHIVDQSDRMVFNAYFLTDIGPDRTGPADRAGAAGDRELLRAIPDLILLVDSSATILDLIQGDAGLLVTAPGSAKGRALDEVIPAFQGLGRDLVSQTLTSRSLSLHDLTVDLNEGFPRRFEARFVMTAGERCVIVIQDVTAIHPVKATLQRHASIFEHSFDGILIADATGVIIDCNPAAIRMFGREREVLVQQPMALLFSPQDRAGFNRMVASALAATGSWSGTTPFFRGDGSQGMCVVHYVVVPDETGQSASIIGTNREVPLGVAGPGGSSLLR